MKAHGLARIGRDAEVRYTQSGKQVASISLAFTYGRKGDDGNRPTQWVEAALWGERAESAAPYLLKGKQIVAYLEDVRIETYRKNDGSEAVKMVAKLADFELVANNAESTPVQKPKPAPVKAQIVDDGYEDIPF